MTGLFVYEKFMDLLKIDKKQAEKYKTACREGKSVEFVVNVDVKTKAQLEKKDKIIEDTKEELQKLKEEMDTMKNDYEEELEELRNELQEKAGATLPKGTTVELHTKKTSEEPKKTK